MKKTTKRKYTKKIKEPEPEPELEISTDPLEGYMADITEKLAKIADGLTGEKGEPYLAKVPDMLETVTRVFNRLNSQLSYLTNVQSQILRCLAMITQTPSEYIKLPKFTSEDELRELVQSILRLQKEGKDEIKKLAAPDTLEELEIGG